MNTPEKRVLVMIADGTEEIEAVTVVDILRRAGAEVTVASEQEGPVVCSQGTRLIADKTLDKVVDQDFDLVYMPGGLPGATNLGENPLVKQILETMQTKKGYIAAICAAPIQLGRLGFLDGIDFTCNPAQEKNIVAGNYKGMRVLASDNIITSKSSGTTMELAFRLVEILYGSDKKEEVNKGVFARLE